MTRTGADRRGPCGQSTGTGAGTDRDTGTGTRPPQTLSPPGTLAPSMDPSRATFALASLIALAGVALGGCVGAPGPGPSTAGPAAADEAPVIKVDVSAAAVRPDETVTLDASGSHDPDGGDLGFAWDLGDGTTATGPTVEHAYDATGNVTVSLTVTDDEGTTNTTEVPIAVAETVYVQEVWFTWDRPQLDVLILGVQDPVVGAAIQEAIDAWEDGAPQLAPAWLADTLSFRVHWPVLGGVPPADFDPDIYFVPAGFFASQGPTDGACTAHAPVGYLAPDPLDTEELYFTAAHEFGHCLGLTHVFENGEEYEPAFDLLGGGSVHDSFGKSCPSNLNVQVLERVFSGASGTVAMAPWDYHQSDC